jgi:hypothetical protein
MARLSIFIFIGLCFAVIETTPVLAYDPLESLKKFSDFQKVDEKRLLAGEIISQRGPLMNFPNGISSQICFFVPIAPEEIFKRLQAWDPTNCASLKVYATSGLKIPCELNEFKKLHLDHRERPVKWLMEKTLATTPGKLDLNLNRSEAHELSVCVKKDHSPASVSSCWAEILFKRATAFQLRGIDGILPYETAEETFSPAIQIRLLLQEQPKITSQFAPILQKTGLLKDGSGISSLQPVLNWSLFEANHHATFNLGAVYQLDAGDHFQMLDIDYYASSTYYSSATLYGIWPIRNGKQIGSLVWRGDFLAAPMLKYTKGIERIAFGVIMIQEIKKVISCFLDEIRTKP